MIRRASLGESRRLSELAFRSKAHWGYSSAFVEARREELGVTRSMVKEDRVYASEQDGEVAGFSSLEDPSESDIESGHLFVDPDFLDIGVGSRLAEHAWRTAAELQRWRGDARRVRLRREFAP